MDILEALTGERQAIERMILDAIERGEYPLEAIARARLTMESDFQRHEKSRRAMIDELDADISSLSSLIDERELYIESLRSEEMSLEESIKQLHVVHKDTSHRLHKETQDHVLRRKMAESEAEKSVHDLESHRAATQLILQRRNDAEETTAKEESRSRVARIEAERAESIARETLAETSKIVKGLERYRADQNNLEEWERKLTQQAQYLARLMGAP